MFIESRLLFMFVETPLHAGAGTGVEAIDLPIQRERATHYPMVQAPGIKGALRSQVLDAKSKGKEIDIIFGPEVRQNSEPLHAGAFSPGDARILLFPVRSLRGVTAWITSLDVLQRWQREAIAAGITTTQLPKLPDREPTKADEGQQGTASCYSSGNGAVVDQAVVLEEFTYNVQEEATMTNLANWLAENALPSESIFDWWRKELRQKLILLPNDDFRDFTQYSTEVLTRIRLDAETKTVQTGALWTEEHLPTDTLLFAPVRATRFRAGNGRLPTNWANKRAEDAASTVLDWVSNSQNIPHRIQLGGDETVGRGMISLRWLKASEVKHNGHQ